MDEKTKDPTPEQLAAAEAVATTAPPVSKAEVKAKEKAAAAFFANQKKVRIRIHQDQGPQRVVINGHFFSIPAGESTEVPEQVAEVLAQAKRI